MPIFANNGPNKYIYFYTTKQAQFSKSVKDLWNNDNWNRNRVDSEI